MNYLVLGLITAILSFPQRAYEQASSQNPPPVERASVPEILARIAVCESRDRHFDENGKVLKGSNKYDIGKYQINAL